MEKPKSFHIMVTDRNHKDCDLIISELEKEDYTVTCVRNGMEAYNTVLSPTSLDAIILDPKLLYPYGHSLFGKILQHNPSVQIIVHTDEDLINKLKTGNNIHIIGRNTSNINYLKDKLRSYLRSQKGLC